MTFQFGLLMEFPGFAKNCNTVQKCVTLNGVPFKVTASHSKPVPPLYVMTLWGKKKVKLSRYRPGQALGVPGG
jgi:hypothetical protein